MRRAEGATDWVIDKDNPRRGHFADDVMGGADEQRGNAVAFDDMGDETDGLMAERSIGHEQGEVDLRLFHISCNRRPELVFDLAVVPQPAHAREMKWRQTADDAALLQIG